MLLQSLLDGKEPSSCILIEDDLDHMGRACLKSFITSLAQRYESVLVLLTEVNPASFCSRLPHHLINKLHILDGATNPDSWQVVSTSSPHHQVSSHGDVYGEILTECRLRGEVAVVLDSLDEMLLHRSVSYTCQTLHRLSNHESSSGSGIKQVVSLVHSDLHDDVTLQCLRHTATTCVTMSRPKDTTNYNYASKILHKRASGKVLRSEEQYNISDDFTICDISEILHLKAPQIAEAAPDPTANLTFNLSLSSEEREARSQLVLPYLHKQRKTEDFSESSAKIFYQPDEADDFDEEDPDDDLDI